MLGFLFDRSDIPFSADDAHRFLPWLIGVMACLVTLLLCLELTVNSWIIDRGRDYAGNFTINIPADTEGLADKAAKVQDAVKKQPGITSITQISESGLKDMLKNWLGSNESLDGLPLPIVFEASIDQRRNIPFDYDALEKSLQTIAPGIEIDAHKRWVEAFANFTATVQCLMLLLTALLLSGMAAMIAFTSRASLRLHARIVHLLHSIGAEDEYITRQFQKDACMLVLPGAAFGALVAALLYWGVGFYMASLPMSLLPSLALSGKHIILLLLMPPACAAAAWYVAHHAVSRQLQAVL